MRQNEESPAACADSEAIALLQPMDDTSGAIITLQPMESSRWNMWMCPEGSCSPWRIHTGAGTQQDLWPLGDQCWSSLFLMNCNLWTGPTLEQFLKKQNPWKGPKIEQCVKDCML